MTKTTTPDEGEMLVDAGRAAELLGYSYNAIIKAIEDGSLVSVFPFERKGGGQSSLIRKRDLEDYRHMLIRRYETMPKQADRLADLQQRKVLA